VVSGMVSRCMFMVSNLLYQRNIMN